MRMARNDILLMSLILSLMWAIFVQFNDIFRDINDNIYQEFSMFFAWQTASNVMGFFLYTTLLISDIEQLYRGPGGLLVPIFTHLSLNCRCLLS